VSLPLRNKLHAGSDASSARANTVLRMIKLQLWAGVHPSKCSKYAVVRQPSRRSLTHAALASPSS
jgi:hypothetical protein